ncbi:MAG: pyrimidine-nucleoside phosphorylase [Desulfitobacteriaceae bacterium]|nr:pyrimidine-nucleoside phosphorylase [Desulfitobacteriaceae bacterium]MDD4752242.1 pyrimidine-nucleoside phosphorylase [Desulfitobacteriaceae bacterium]
MRCSEIIEKKRNGEILSCKEMEFLIDGYVKGLIPDYQIAAFLMAIYFQGLTEEETIYLTEAMINSGERIDLSSVTGVKADKHSTGGVGDKTTLVLGPLIAAGGIKVAKMSGRGLGHTGGTLDKLESIPGFRTQLSPEEFRENVNKLGIAVVGQTADLVPADKKLYALRDVTATVESVPLIASSIMSKKIAAGADVIVLDVKYGSGAFMKTAEQAKDLADAMVKIGLGLGKKMAALITNMDRPLGYAIGNALEIKEAIDTLKGKGPVDLSDLCLNLAGEIFYLAGKASDFSSGRELARGLLSRGAALDKFREFIAAQGGSKDVVETENLLPQADFRFTVQASVKGWINNMKTRDLGLAAMKLGAGRSTKDDTIDSGVGLVCYKKTGDYVEKGDTLAMIHANDEDQVDEVKKLVLQSYIIKETPPAEKPLIYGIVKESGFEKWSG